MNEREQVAAEPTQMLVSDRQNGSRRDRSVDRAASRSESVSPGRSRERVDGADRRFGRKPGAERRKNHRRIFAGAPVAVAWGA